MHGVPPCLLFEDEHLLAVNKPPGMNTHAPAPFAGEGIYDWLRHREPRWANLSIIHRLDKETSGVLVFGKTPLANRSLTEQFTARSVNKRYLLLTHRPPASERLSARSGIQRTADRYHPAKTGAPAETRFSTLEKMPAGFLVAAEPLTGRTHQIRVHAAEHGFPIFGDLLYGGLPFHRVCLHATSISFQHPAHGGNIVIQCDPAFEDDPRVTLRTAVIDSSNTTAWRLVHGASDGIPGCQIDRLGDFFLVQSPQPPQPGPAFDFLRRHPRRPSATGTYWKKLLRDIRTTSKEETSPQRMEGEEAPSEFVIQENGLKFLLSFREGYSVGLFLDQRDNRRRFLANHVAAGFPLFPDGAQSREVLNAFSYTCGFSVCAARSGARVTSLDLSRKYLDWGRRNFLINSLDPEAHDFIYGDAFDWMRRLSKKGRKFDVVILDPPTFSRSKEHGVFTAARDFGKLATAAFPLLKPEGILFASTNAADLAPERFLSMIHEAAAGARRRITAEHYVPQPPDFPVTRDEPAYLKTVWMRV